MIKTTPKKEIVGGMRWQYVTKRQNNHGGKNYKKMTVWLVLLVTFGDGKKHNVEPSALEPPESLGLIRNPVSAKISTNVGRRGNPKKRCEQL